MYFRPIHTLFFSTLFSATCLFIGTQSQAQTTAWQTSNLNARRAALLQAAGLNDEFSAQLITKPLNEIQTKTELEALLSVIDRNAVFNEYARWSDTQLTVYKDRHTKSVVDFTVQLATTPTPQPATPHAAYLRHNTSLEGLRVALDPGHFGGTYDHVVGKFAEHNGAILREGEIALETAKLVALQLVALGVRADDILLTRTQTATVTNLTPESFPFETHQQTAALKITDEPWFDRLITQSSSISQALRNFLRAPAYRHAVSPLRRMEYFLQGEDLIARAEMINHFRPHVTIIIHYDTALGHALQNSRNNVRAFIPGGILPDELGTTSERAYFTRTALHTTQWLQSARLSTQVVRGISNSTGVPIAQRSPDRQLVPVAAGVFPRNLFLTRTANEYGALAYVEALYYDHEDEFNRFLDRSRTSTYNGEAFPHSARVEQVATGITNGILNYSLPARPQ